MFIGFHAKKRAGKDTLARMLAERWNYGSVAFADRLYDGLRAMFPWVRPAYWEDRNLVVPELGKSINELLQSLGTEWGRTLVHDRVWVEAADRDARKELDLFGRSGVVFRDIRYDNEAEYVLSHRGKIILIESERGVVINGHSSECGISPQYIHATITNDGTPEDLWVQFTNLCL